MSKNRVNDNTHDERVEVIDRLENVSDSVSNTNVQEKTLDHTIEDGPLEVSPEEFVETPDQYSEADLRKTRLTEAEKSKLNNTPYAQGKRN